jgi:CheY-like chemotaxis protein
VDAHIGCEEGCRGRAPCARRGRAHVRAERVFSRRTGERSTGTHDRGRAFPVSRVMSEAAADTKPVRIAIADDHDPFRALLRTLLSFADNVELVGEAADGIEAVKLAEREDPDVFLLDVNMPRLDGVGAAELIRTFRPGTRVVLHTVALDADVSERARAAGLRVLDKTKFDAVVEELVTHAADEPRDEPFRQIESLVVTALQAGARDEALVVVRPDGCVPFYDARAAEALGLPYPAREISLAHLRDCYEALRPDGRPYPPEERPIARALRERKPIEARFGLRRDGQITVYESKAIPFFDERGNLLGAAHYFRQAA